MLGALLGCLGIAASLLWMPSPAAAEPEPEFVVEFVPASMLASSELDAEPVEPEPTSEPDAEPAGEDPGATISDAATRPNPESEPGAPRPTPRPTPKPAPAPSPAPADNPFVVSGAWSELVADGDPWATAVMRELRKMKVPAWGGKLSADSPFGFRLRICKDGRVDKVLRKLSTGDANLDATLAHEISRVKLPPVPATMAAGMNQACMVLGYEFTWLPTGVR
ncbi:MAG TPA: hypothetical protein VK034_01925 [Enhygromyxa sp.]|nr:hypothetical protein [Enhygromyxa sp.]